MWGRHPACERISLFISSLQVQCGNLPLRPRRLRCRIGDNENTCSRETAIDVLPVISSGLSVEPLLGDRSADFDGTSKA